MHRLRTSLLRCPVLRGFVETTHPALRVDRDESKRIIWPLALGFFEEIHVIISWCELRSDFRHFRTDRINQLTLLENRYPKRRQVLIKKWREINNIPEQ